MITQVGDVYLVSIQRKHVTIYGRAFHTEQDARLWEKDALLSIDEGRPIPCEKIDKYRVGQELERPCS